MGFESTPHKTAAWVTYLDDDIRCLENSRTSKAAWLRSLGLGCLNKCNGEKLRVYSHIRALSSKLPEPFFGLRTTTEGHITCTDARIVGGINGQDEGQCLATDLRKPAVSLIILEDFSKPPPPAEEIFPLLLTPSEFFRFLFSNNWGGRISLRVIGGEVLSLLLTALYILERDQRLNSTVLYSNLNNRLKATSIDEKPRISTPPGELNRALDRLPKPYQPNKEFVYEKMSVEIVFYEKCEASNIPYIIPETDNSDKQVIKLPIQREVSHRPFALREHKMNYVRLPKSEDTNTREIIDKLEDELEVLKTKNIVTTDQQIQPLLLEKTTADSEKVEWIAEDPYLVKKPSFTAGGGTSKSDVKEVTTLRAKETQFISRISSLKISPPSLQEAGVVASARAVDIIHSDAGLPVEQLTVDTASPLCSSDGSYGIITSPSEFFREVEEEPILKRLNLTRNELYIAGLYSPQKENRINTRQKLHYIKQLRMKQRKEIERSIYQKVKEKATCDISDRFKRLAAEKENARRKATAPKVYRKAKILKVSRTAPTSSWEKYSKDQEVVEMDSALINNLEKGILERIVTYVGTKVEDKNKETEQESRTKSIKNKSKNNPYDFLSSVPKSSRKQTLRQKEQRAYNSNTNATNNAVSQCSQVGTSNTQLKLPAIKNAIVHTASRSEHKDKYSVTLPPLLDRRQTTRRRKAENNQTEHKRLKDVFRIDELTDNTKENMILLKTEAEKYSSASEESFKDSSNNAFEQTVALPEILHTEHNVGETHFNINQNQSNSAEHEKVIDLVNGNQAKLSQESFHTQSIVNDENAQDTVETPADIYRQRMRFYSCECTCYECVDLEENLNLDDKDSVRPDYPPFLGRMRRDFNFLKCRSYKPKIMCSTTSTAFVTPEINDQVVCDYILRVLDTMMLRKEIVTSSLGYTYMTITFTKPEVTK